MSRPKVFVTRFINNETMEILKKTCDVCFWSGVEPVPRDHLLKSVENVDGLFCTLSDKIDKTVLDAAKSLRAISTMSVGYDHLDVAEIKKRGIKVGYTPTTLTDATAELALGLTLTVARNLTVAAQAAKCGEWRAWSPFWMCGPGLKNATIGLFGFGRIGQEIAKRLIPFKPRNILYCARSAKPEAEALAATRASFEELLAKSDYVIAICSYNEETAGIFNAAAFKQMKKTALFINVSRGGVVNQDDLIAALKDGTIGGAGLDVTTPEPLPLNSELFQLENCVVFPHIGSATTSCRAEMADLTARNLVAALYGADIPSELIL